jgi:hypothetical protein
MGYGQGSHRLLLLACSQNMALMWYQTNQTCGGAGQIFQNLHDVMYMSINHGEMINAFKDHGRVVIQKNLHKHKPNDVWTNYF